MLKYMLDSNIVIYTIKNRPESVRTLFKENEGLMCLSSTTWSELIFGVERSSKQAQNLRDIEGMAARLDVLNFDMPAANHFGQVRAELYNKGTPIGPYDMQIAGHARSLGLILVSNNLKEFSRVDGLRLENWVQ